MKKVSNELNPYKKKNLENRLMIDFHKSLENPEFNEFVSKLKCPYEILSKYTSLLEEGSKEYSHCQKCKGLFMCQNKVEGHAYLPNITENQIDFCYKACKFYNKNKEDNKFLNNIYSFDIPREIKEARIKDIYTDDKNRFEVIKYLNEFIKNYKGKKEVKGLYLYGNFGSGKTYLIAAMFNELARLNYKSAIIFWPEYLRDLKSSFSSDFDKKIEKIKNIPLLLIDDIGAENTTAWGRDEIFCPIIQYRMQEHLPTFFTSNLDLKSLEQHFSFSKDGVENIKARRIIERIKQMTVQTEMISKNLRK